jgi:hypothetical protein
MEIRRWTETKKNKWIDSYNFLVLNNCFFLIFFGEVRNELRSKELKELEIRK